MSNSEMDVLEHLSFKSLGMGDQFDGTKDLKISVKEFSLFESKRVLLNSTNDDKKFLE
jgi:hypothetical protein